MQRHVFVVALIVLCAAGSAAQSRVSVGVSGGLQTSLDDFDGGASVQGTVLYSLSDYVQLSLSSGYLSWQSSYGSRFRAIPLLVGARVHAHEGDILPYGKFDIGLYSTRTSVSEFDRPIPLSGFVVPSDTFPMPIDVRPVAPFVPRSYTTTFGYDIGVGVMLNLSEQLMLDIGAAIHYLDKTRPTQSGMMVIVPMPTGETSSHRYFTVFAAGVFVRL
jgi:hypothetical protein